MKLDCLIVTFDGCVDVVNDRLPSSLYNKLEKIRWSNTSCLLQGNTENRLYDHNYWSCPIVIDLDVNNTTFHEVTSDHVPKDLKHIYRGKCHSTAVCLKLALNEEHNMIVNSTINYASEQCQLTEEDIIELRTFLNKPGIIAGTWLVTIYAY